MPLKAKMKHWVGNAVSTDFLEKITEYAIAARAPSVRLDEAEIIPSTGSTWEEIIDRGRIGLWSKTLARVPNPDILLLEFGVWKADSTREFVKLNRSERSLFYGFDSFEGLPEDWRDTKADRFDLGGNIPHIDDERVKFVKGWFRDTVPGLLPELVANSAGRSVVIHYDADLYSSTLYLLFTLGAHFKRYHFIFDEFSGHETRALYNYVQATSAECRFFYRLDWQGCPQVVSGEMIIP